MGKMLLYIAIVSLTTFIHEDGGEVGQHTSLTLPLSVTDPTCEGASLC